MYYDIKRTVRLYWKNVFGMRNLLLEKERPGKEEKENPKDLQLHLTNVSMWVWLKCEMYRETG